MAGRPKKKIEAEQVLGLAQLGATVKEIAAFFHCGETLIKARFRKELDEGKANLKISIRKAQIRLAIGDERNSGNATMLIWLGKQVLKQSDEPIQDEQSASEDNGKEELIQELNATMDRIDGSKPAAN